MKKIVILNVGGALSCFGEFDNRRFVIDLGNKGDFSPVDDFLIPLFKKRKLPLSIEKKGKGRYHIEQLFLSHLDKDHIADYDKFRNYFHPAYMTCPSDNTRLNKKFIINREKIGELADLKIKVLDDMQNRSPIHRDRPLQSLFDNIKLNFIYPVNCENEKDLSDNYANNLSLILFAKVGGKTVLFPGDILKNGMKHLIENNSNFRELLETEGVDYLVAPHHGLQTSFSQKLFDTMKDNKVRLNIISEKIRKADSKENRSDVDGRYYREEYSTGENSLEQRAVKTSGGHIVIDFDTPENEIKKYSDIEDVIEEFCN
jgi:beta-lactamase superfamily II metal-dependent hydrolase